MSNTLKDAADATVQTVSQLVHDARGHLEHLPVPHHRTPWWRSKWSIITAAALVGASAFALIRRRRVEDPDEDRMPTMTERMAADRAEMVHRVA